MATLSQRFVQLKTQISGNRERRNFEFTATTTVEKQVKMTKPSRYNQRILGELDFAIRLSALNDHRYDGEIDQALTLLENAMRQDGVLTNAVCREAEEIMQPLAPAAKEYEMILVGHAHIDMNWQWGWQETVATTLATFRTMLDIMDEYPEFCFSQSQASVYKIVEEYDPEMMEKIRRRIAEGRWEITASAWVETDKNMPNTESLMRHIQYTKAYLRDTWGVDPASLEIDFSPDTFGHSANLPELDALGGVKYYYHCRAMKETGIALYRWRGLSGKEMLCYREQQWYNSAINSRNGAELLDACARSAGLKTGMIVYGVGDHGGGPTRRDVERGIDMMSWPIYPTVRFGKMRDFFQKAEAVRDQVPLIDHELNVIFPGCYTTQSRIKMGNRASERALIAAEGLNTLAAEKVGVAFETSTYEKAWRDVLFTHFHDILTGSCVRDSREHAMGLYATSLAAAQTKMEIATRKVADAIDISAIEQDEDSRSRSSAAGVGYGAGGYTGGMPHSERGSGKTRIFHVFNPTAICRREQVEISVWDWIGDLNYLQVTDAASADLPFQRLDNAWQHWWDHKFFRVLITVEVAPFGYTTVVVKENMPDTPLPIPHMFGGDAHGPESVHILLENENLCAAFDRQNGRLVSLIDKKSGQEYLRAGESGGVCLIDTERATSDAWHIGQYRRVTPLTDAVCIRNEAGGDLRNGFTVEYRVGRSSTVRLTVTLAAGAEALAYHLDADWLELPGETVPVLSYLLPLAEHPAACQCDVPGAAVRRLPMDTDMPALQYALAYTGSDRAAGIVNASKYGYRLTEGGNLYATFINTACNPDPYPEYGKHEFGFHVGVFPADYKTMEETATRLNNPLTYQPAKGSHGGTLPVTGSLLNFESNGCVISSISMEGDAKLVRLYNLNDTAEECVLSFDRPVSVAESVDLLGNVIETLSVREGKAVFTAKPHAIMSVRLK